jgi:hypothetical protein
VVGESVEDERNTVGGFVVYDFGGFKGCKGRRSIVGGYRGHFEEATKPLRGMDSRAGSGSHLEVW